ncbi:uncharacterized protein M6B38_138390 [Iris pallida]|uniref:Pheromone receptor n=1 Tax=Iris pallida TaxID=29817 RepID=A0AAX6FEK8_IRIPA|nr:uncharacterized protein M6B38_138390 [Iris pallida]
MEVMVPTKEFHFDSTTSTPYVSAPTSPKCFPVDPFDYYCHYTSAPTSPARAAAIYAASVVPFDWEETPGTPKSRKSPAAADDDGGDDNDDEYVFEFSGHLDVLPPKLAAADELFEEGKIRPLKPPPRLYNAASSPRSPRSPRLWSPRHKKKSDGGGIDPFAVAMAEATWERGRVRGRGADPSLSSTPSSRSRKESRSLSPMRGEFMGSLTQFSADSPSQASTSAAAAPSAKNRGGGGSSKKWRLRDLLLFRSASEGRATGNTSKDPLRKFSISPTTSSSSSITSSSPGKRGGGGEDSRNSSFRSTDSVGSSTRRGGMSPHEMHYTSNRAASEETRRRTALPFGSHGLFGCLRFNPAVQSVARGFHSSSTLNHRRQL